MMGSVLCILMLTVDVELEKGYVLASCLLS